MAINYKENPHKDDFMNEVMDLLKETDPVWWEIILFICLIISSKTDLLYIIKFIR